MPGCLAKWTGIQEEKDLKVWHSICLLVAFLAVLISANRGLLSGNLWPLEAVGIFLLADLAVILFVGVVMRLIYHL